MQSFRHFLRKLSRLSPSPTPCPKDPPRKETGMALFFGKYLLFTNTASSGLLMLLGDWIQQEIEFRDKKLARKTQRYDTQRLGRMFLVGLSMGPVHHYYYGYLSVILPLRNFATVTKKILLDQFVMSPVCIAQFFYVLGLLEGKTVQDTNEEFMQKFMRIYAMDWCIWPPTQFLNFYLLPDRYQVLYINAVTMIYNVFLSYMKHDHSLRLERQS